jgi:acyl dehydratase
VDLSAAGRKSVAGDLNGFDREPMFTWTAPAAFEVVRERLQAYAAATNDPIAAHRAGDIASPVFNVVPAFKVIAPLTLEMPPAELRMNGLHGEQLFEFHRPIVPGMVLLTRAMPIGIIPKSTGVTITVRGETTSDGEAVVDQYVTVFIRKATIPEPLGEGPPRQDVDSDVFSRAPIAVETTRFDADQTLRYRDASGDDMPIHVDNAAAREFGLPGIILHGNCTLAMAMQTVLAASAADDVGRLKRLSVRFSRVVQPHETVTTSVWAAGRDNERARFAFQTAVDDGSLCLSGGVVEVAN